MPATEGEIKLVARITALEILVQQLICLACNRDLDEVEDYRERVMEDASVTSVKGFDPAASDLPAAELQAALHRIFAALIRKTRQDPEIGA